MLFILLAATCAALSNLFFRKNSDNLTENQNSNGFLVLFYFFSLLSSIVFFPEILKGNPNFTILIIGGVVGVLNVGMMLLTSQALKRGPAGLTFAFQNASAVFPGILLFLIFGSELNFSFSYFQALGVCLVLFGLYLGTKNKSESPNKISFQWLFFAIGCFIVQILCLTLIQGRCVLFECDKVEGVLKQFATSQSGDVWFMPGQFAVAFLLQSIVFLREKRKLQMSEIKFGLFGGFANFGSTCFLLLATKFAYSFEKAILFPSFAVLTIILCNTWANRLYKEEFNVKANIFCSLGIFIGLIA